MPVRDANGMQAPPQWDANGKPFYALDDGQKHYLSPMEQVGIQSAAKADGTSYDPRLDKLLGTTPNSSTTDRTDAAEALIPHGSFASARGGWDAKTGKMVSGGINWGGLGGLLMGGAAVAAPLIIPALMASAGAGAAVGGSSLLEAGAAPTSFLGTTGVTSGLITAGGAGGAAAGGVAPLVSSSILPSGSMTGAAVPGAGMSGTLSAGTSLTNLAEQAAKKYAGNKIQSMLSQKAQPQQPQDQPQSDGQPQTDMYALPKVPNLMSTLVNQQIQQQSNTPSGSNALTGNFGVPQFGSLPKPTQLF
jgi:hypothetical protein